VRVFVVFRAGDMRADWRRLLDSQMFLRKDMIAKLLILPLKTRDTIAHKFAVFDVSGDMMISLIEGETPGQLEIYIRSQSGD
jgi:putative heme degradation protein